METNEPIRIEKTHQRLSDAVFSALRKAILDGQLTPGQWLRQEALAQELDVSQITVREALNRLVGEGLCVHVPYKGTRVIAPSPEDLEDIYDMRALLEGLATELAAHRITSKELTNLKQLLPDTYVDSDPASVDRAREANREFHEIIINASDRPYLIMLLKQIWDWIDPLRLYTRTVNTEEGKNIREKWGEIDRQQHTRLIELLEIRDGKGARKLVDKYVQEACKNLISYISSQAEDDTGTQR